METLLALAGDYHLALMSGILVILAVVWWRKWGQGRLLGAIMTLLAAAILYEAVSGEPVSRIPARINALLEDETPPGHSRNPHYYRSPEELNKLLEE